MLFELTFLRLLHVVLGAFWAGALVFTTFFLMPALKDAGPAGGAVMAGIQKRKYMMWLPIAAILTLLSGIRLFWIHSQGWSPVYLASTRGLIYGVSGALAIVAFVVGITTIRPAMMKAAALAEQAGAAQGAERQALVAQAGALRERAGRVGLIAAWLVIATTIGMAVARYL